MDDPVISLRSQFAGSNIPYEIDTNTVVVAQWVAGASHSAGDFIKPTDGNNTGFVYRTSLDGQSGATEPAWPVTGTVDDGSLIWTPSAPPASGEDSIASVSWSQEDPPDAALTITNESNTSLTATAFLGGGTVGNTYMVVTSITMVSTAVFISKIALSIV